MRYLAVSSLAHAVLLGLFCLVPLSGVDASASRATRRPRPVVRLVSAAEPLSDPEPAWELVEPLASFEPELSELIEAGFTEPEPTPPEEPLRGVGPLSFVLDPDVWASVPLPAELPPDPPEEIVEGPPEDPAPEDLPEVAGREPPRLLEAPRPAYPRLSIRNREEGSVLIRLDVDALGVVTGTEVVRSSGFDRLDRAAVRALRKWRFDPASENGRDVAASYEHLVTFRLDRSRRT